MQVRGGTGEGLVCGTDERFQLDSEPVIFLLDVLNRLFEDRAAQLSAAERKGGVGEEGDPQLVSFLASAAPFVHRRSRGAQ